MPASSKASTAADIFAALTAINPFEKPPIVREQNIWGESFPDVPALNAVASDSLFEAMKKVQAAESISEKVTSMVFTAEKGVGKSHVIKRIRHRLQATGEGTFIYASADKYGDLNYVDALFQQSVAESLDQLGSEGVTQWQEVAALMVARAIRASNAQATILAARDLVSRFDQVYHNSRARNRDLVSDLSQAIRRLKPNTDLYLLRAIIWTLSEERGSLAVKWLAGEPLSTQDAADLRLPVQRQAESERNASALSFLCKILAWVSEYKPLVVCFDELDTLVTNDDGYTTVMMILDLVKRLAGAVGQFEGSNGIVILTVMQPDSWRQMKLTRAYSSEKISSYGKPISLDYLNADTMCDLVTVTLQRFYEKKGLIAPTPIYPFDVEELSVYGKGKPFPREALTWLATKLNEKIEGFSPPIVVLPPMERFKQAYESAIAQFEEINLDSNELIASALSFSFQKITELSSTKDQLIAGVLVKAIEEVTPKRQNSGWLNFKLVGEENDELVVIGIAVLQQTHGLSVGAGFRRLLDTETFGLSRGCLVRSRDRKIQRSWDSYGYYQQLVANGGEWVDLTIEDIKPLMALQYVYEHHEKLDLSLKRLDSFAFVRKLLQQNPLIIEILSRPEGLVVEAALEGEALQPLNEDVDPQDFDEDLLRSLEAESADETAVQPNLAELTEALFS